MSQCHCSSCSCHSEEIHEHKNEGLKKVLLGIGAALFVCAVVLKLLNIPIAPIILFFAAYILIGFDTFCELIEAFREHEFFGETTLMVISSLGAMIIGEMAEGCMVMLLFAIGEILEEKAQGKSKKNIEQLLALKPKVATKQADDGEEIKVLPETLEVGDTVIVKAGDTIPCDGEITGGTANVDTSSITGESVPAVLDSGKNVRCGYVSLDGSLKIKVTASYADNTFSKILEIISRNSERKSRSENFVTRFAKIYTPAVMAAAFLVMLIGCIATGNITTWIYRGLVFLATSCPCAFVISVPLTFFFGLGEMSRIGLLVKGSEYIEKLSHLKVIAFDKTGTITKGELSVVNVVSDDKRSKQEILSLCASLEKNSNHPIALQIVKYAKENGELLLEASEVSEISGIGISGVVDGKRVSCGNARILPDGENFLLSGETTKVYVTVDGEAAGAVELSDEIRNEAASVVEKLKKCGILKTVMLTGDGNEGAERVAKECGIDEVYRGLLPQEKSEILERIISENKDGYTAFVGDGINDAPVLALADVGIAVGGTGASIAVETADAVILGSSLSALSRGVCAARSVMARVKFNVIFAITVKLLILILTLLGVTNMWIAVFGDVGVTILVILNSLRKFKV